MIKFADLSVQYKKLKPAIDQAIQRVLGGGRYILGAEVAEFEREFANYCGSKLALGCASGTDALALSLMVLGVGSGDEVITVSNTAFPTAVAISMVGARPVFVDVEEESMLMDLNQVPQAITSRTKAVIPVHLFGQPVDVERLKEIIAPFHSIQIVEDCCQAHGTCLRGIKVGNFGIIGCFSFYPTKNLGAYGDGGMIVTNDQGIYEKLMCLRNYGQTKKDYYVFKGFNSRLDEIQAAILRVKLPYLDTFNQRRRYLAGIYDRELNLDVYIKPQEKTGCLNNYHLYVIRITKRDQLRQHLLEMGIRTMIHYPLSIHLQQAYTDLCYKEEDFPIAEKCSREILSLPMYPELKEEEVIKVCEVINHFYSIYNA